jgi:hypothetical protein
MFIGRQTGGDKMTEEMHRGKSHGSKQELQLETPEKTLGRHEAIFKTERRWTKQEH